MKEKCPGLSQHPQGLQKFHSQAESLCPWSTKLERPDSEHSAGMGYRNRDIQRLLGLGLEARAGDNRESV